MINSHMFPSRMTPFDMTMAASQLALVTGEQVSGASFDSASIDEMDAELKKHGIIRGEKMICGITGKLIGTNVIRLPSADAHVDDKWKVHRTVNSHGTPVAVQNPTGTRVLTGFLPIKLLNHIAASKEFSRSIVGSRSVQHRNPLPGKKKGGGLKYGETDGMVSRSLGATSIQTDAQSTRNDEMANVPVCKQHHIIANEVAEVGGTPICPICGDGRQIARTKIPWSFVKVQRELLSMNVLLRPEVKPVCQ